MTFKTFLNEDPMWHGDRRNVFIGDLSTADQAKLKAEWQKAQLKFKKSSQQPDSYDFSTEEDFHIARAKADPFRQK